MRTLIAALIVVLALWGAAGWYFANVDEVSAGEYRCFEGEREVPCTGDWEEKIRMFVPNYKVKYRSRGTEPEWTDFRRVDPCPPCPCDTQALEEMREELRAILEELRAYRTEAEEKP